MMNERIKKLALQATEIIETTDHCSGKSESITQVNLEKFAELIVAECANVAKHHVMNISTYADADFVEKQIQEHFGVEE